MASAESAVSAKAPVALRAMRPLLSQPVAVVWSPAMVKAPPPCRMSLLFAESEPAPKVKAPPLMKIQFWLATVVPAKVLTPERVWLPVPCLVKVKRVGSKTSSVAPDLVAAADRVTVLAISSIAVTVVPLFTPAP